MGRRICLFFYLLLLSIFYLPSLVAQSGEDPLWMRYPAISPDGQNIVFSYQGNLYKVAATGGQAVPVTLHPAHDISPVWSSDGRHIAFASNRYGNYDVFLTSERGGAPVRLTFHSANDLPSSFTADGKKVLFSSARLDSRTNRQFPSRTLPEVYEVDVEGKMLPGQVLTVPALNLSLNGDGSAMLFEDAKGYEDAFRKHHTSSISRDIWLYTKSDGSFRRLTAFAGEDRDPVFAADGNEYYYLSELNGTMNVYRSSLDAPNEYAPITNFELHPVRYLSMAADGTLCYSYNGEIYTQGPGQAPLKVSVEIYADQLANPISPEAITGRVSEMVLSPNGKEIAFVHRGEVFVTAVDGSLTKRVTNTPEQERMIDFSPDGKSIVYSGERNNSWNLYRSSLSKEEEKYFVNATTLSEEVILANATETFQPAFSPDGKEVAFIEDRTKLRIINLDNKQVRTILDGSNTFSYSDGDQHYDWSPDGKWLLVNFLPNEYWFTEVGLIDASGKEPLINLSKSGFYDSNPVWMQKGEMLIWQTDKHGLDGVAKSGPSQVDVYGMFLTKKAFDRYRLSKEEFELSEGTEKKDKKEDKEKEEEAGKKAALPQVKIELDGIEDRKARLTIHSSSLADAVVTHDGKYLLYFSRTEKGYDLWRTKLRTKETKVLAKFGTGPGPLQLDKEGKNVFVLSSGKIAKVEIESGVKTPIAIKGEMTLDESAERAYLFEHIARQVRKKFYAPDLHGANWDQLVSDYQRFLPHINNNHDFQEMLSELLGELNASHTGARYRPSDPKADATASLGVFPDPDYDGAGVRILEVLHKSPLIRDGSKITTGTVIEKIDGQSIGPRQNYYPFLNRKSGKWVLLSLLNPDTKERWEEKVKPISAGQENELLYQRWIKRNRELTHELSGGRIGYMHIRGMSDRSFRDFLEEVMGTEVNREALVVDSRFNGGGDLVDDLNTFLSGERYMSFQTPERTIGFESQYRWTKPSIVLVGESNYSDAHCFPAGYRDQQIGKIVGMPVPGTCTFVWWERLQNGVVFGIPNMAVLDKNGNTLENYQLEPDIQVRNEYDKVAAGRDQQLERAVEELLKGLE